MTVALVLLDIVIVLSRHDVPALLQQLTLTLPILLLVLHGGWTLTYAQGLLFSLLAACVGFAFEVFGMTYGTFFGDYYVYSSQVFGPVFLGVPLLVPVYWTIFIYAGYSITNSFLHWAEINKPDWSNGNTKLLPWLIFMDGALVVAIDLIMDPLAVRTGHWVWENGGFYFGVPIGNFFGWFVVAVIVAGTFRIYEYYFSQRPTAVGLSFFLIPILDYGILYALFSAYALSFGMNALAFIGGVVMMPVIAINIALFIVRKKYHTVRS